MSEKKVNVISKVDYPVFVEFPWLHFERSWEKYGAVKAIDFDIIQEGMGDPGFEYMIRTGMLYIEDMDVKKDLDIEPEDAKEPVNVIVYTDKQIKDMLIKGTSKALKEALDKTSEEQRENIARRAIEMKITDAEKARILKKVTGIDVAALIEYAIEDEEAEKAEKAKK